MKTNRNIKVLLKSFFANLFLALIKIVSGLLGNSRSLVADGIHSFSDLSTDVLSIFAFKASQKKPDKKHPFGHGQSEYICCIAIGVIIIGLGISIGIKAFTGEVKSPSNFIFYVTIVTMLVKYLVSGYIIKKGKEYNNSLLIASGKESRTDVYSSFIVLVSFLASKLTKYVDIFKYSDSAGCLILALVILYVGIKVLIENIIVILGENESDPVVIEKVKNIILSFKAVKDIKKILLIKYGSYYICELILVFDKKMTIGKSNIIINKLKKKLISKQTQIRYINIEISSEEN